MTANRVLADFPAEGHDHRLCLADALRSAEERCASQGLRLTPLRRQVLELVWQHHEPVKAYDLLELLRSRHRAAAPPTVYRALEFLQNAGLVHRIESLNAFIGCGDPSAPHPGQFLICSDCSTVAELDDPAISRVLAREATRLGFQIESQTIEVRGLCPRCRGGRRTPDRGPAASHP